MTTPLRILSLGAGVQSTTLALMSTTGDIEPFDHVIFADTGWEPLDVYDHRHGDGYRDNPSNLTDDVDARHRVEVADMV